MNKLYLLVAFVNHWSTNKKMDRVEIKAVFGDNAKEEIIRRVCRDQATIIHWVFTMFVSFYINSNSNVTNVIVL